MGATPFVFDMETQDLDDALTLCLLATHPDVHLHAISLNPGTRVQVGVVHAILARLGRTDVPIGARDPKSTAKDVSPFHHRWLGDTAPRDPDGTAVDVLAEAFRRAPASVLLCGGPLHNVRALLDAHDVTVERWFVQGGFAGDNVVPPEHRLAKFVGKTMTESHNFGANKKATLAVLGSARVREKRIVSKNVTHGLVWDGAMQARVEGHAQTTPGVKEMAAAMRLYLEETPEGKALHDPLAACAAIDPSILGWAEVEVLYEAGRWGSAVRAGTNTFVSTSLHLNAFHHTLLRA